MQQILSHAKKSTANLDKLVAKYMVKPEDKCPTVTAAKLHFSLQALNYTMRCRELSSKTKDRTGLKI